MSTWRSTKIAVPISMIFTAWQPANVLTVNACNGHRYDGLSWMVHVARSVQRERGLKVNHFNCFCFLEGDRVRLAGHKSVLWVGRNVSTQVSDRKSHVFCTREEKRNTCVSTAWLMPKPAHERSKELRSIASQIQERPLGPKAP